MERRGYQGNDSKRTQKRSGVGKYVISQCVFSPAITDRMTDDHPTQRSKDSHENCYINYLLEETTPPSPDVCYPEDQLGILGQGSRLGHRESKDATRPALLASKRGTAQASKDTERTYI
jgi:hypothetical protein